MNEQMNKYMNAFIYLLKPVVMNETMLFGCFVLSPRMSWRRNVTAFVIFWSLSRRVQKFVNGVESLEQKPDKVQQRYPPPPKKNLSERTLGFLLERE